MSNTTKDTRPIDAEDVMLNMFRGDKNPTEHVAEEITEEVIEEVIEDVVDDIIEDEPVVVEEEVEIEEEAKPEPEDEIIEDANEEVVDDVTFDTTEWDDNLQEDVSEPIVDNKDVFKGISAELGLGDISNKDDLIKELKSFQKRSEEDDKTIKGLEGLPKELLDAIEVVKNGGDYEQYKNISAIDYNNYDAKAFFIESAKEHFLDENGVLDSESLQDFIDSQDEKMIEIQGTTIKKQFVDKQDAEKQALVNLTKKKKEVTEAKLKDVLSEFDSFNGFKINDTHKEKLYEDITSGKAMKEMFYNKYGEYDMSKVVKAYFYYMKGDQMEKFRSQRAKNSAIREVLKDTTNADLRINGRRVTNNSKVERPHPFDLMAKKYGMISDE